MTTWTFDAAIMLQSACPRQTAGYILTSSRRMVRDQGFWQTGFWQTEFAAQCSRVSDLGVTVTIAANFVPLNLRWSEQDPRDSYSLRIRTLAWDTRGMRTDQQHRRNHPLIYPKEIVGDSHSSR